MITPVLALGLHMLAAPTAPLDVFGATVQLRDVDLLLVAPTDRDALRDKLTVVREHRLSKSGGAPPKPLVVAIDISDVPSLLRGRATGKIKERALELAKHQPKGAPKVSFVVDHDGSIGRAFRGSHKGSTLVTLSPDGENSSGVTVDELVRRTKAATP